MSKKSYACDRCGGKVSAPPYRRISLEEIRDHHEQHCPSPIRRNISGK